MAGSLPNAQCNLAAPGSLPVRIAGYQRRKMYREFLALGLSSADTILDIGVTSDRSYAHSNYLEAWYPHKHRITAVGIDDGAASIEHAYPGIKFVKADGRALPFDRGSFDYVHSSAVLEHAGSMVEQTTFLAEAGRVARKGVFLTTPNRWYPVEFHTVMPLVHWLPKPTFRRVLRLMGHDFFAEERNLNLLSRRQLLSMARRTGSRAAHEVRGVRLLGLTSNLILLVDKAPRQ